MSARLEELRLPEAFLRVLGSQKPILSSGSWAVSAQQTAGSGLVRG